MLYYIYYILYIIYYINIYLFTYLFINSIDSNLYRVVLDHVLTLLYPLSNFFQKKGKRIF